MKLINGILGCALVAGLTTAHAAGSQNGTVIDNVLYTPLNIKLQAQFTTAKGTVREASLTSKDILSILGFSTKDVLATDYDGLGDPADVFVIENGVVVDDLTSDDIFSIEFNDLVVKQNKNGKSGSFTESEKGLLSLSFDFIQNEPTAVIAIAGEEVPPPPSGPEFSFDVSGVYTWSETGAAVKNDGTQKTTTKLNGINIIGDGFDGSAVQEVKAAISGPTDTGDYLLKDGSATGNGSGNLEVD